MSIIKKVESQVENTVQKFGLISGNDRIVCAVSGGKDSTTALHIMNKMFKNVQAITIDAAIGNYSKESLENVRHFCEKEGIKLHVVSFREQFGYSLCYIQTIIKSRGYSLNSCAICGVLKRYLLNKKARELNASVLVTGHNLDDEAQSILMNLLRGNTEMLAKLGPKSGIIFEKKFIPRVKPLYFVPESEVAQYSKLMRFPVKYSRCPCSVDAFRNSIRNLLSDYEKRHPGAKQNIIDYFLSILPKLKEKYRTGHLSYCGICGEPSKNDICRACELVSAIKNRKS